MDRNDLFKFTDITDDDIDRMVEEFRTHTDDEPVHRPILDPFDEEFEAITAQARANMSTAPTFEQAFAAAPLPVDETPTVTDVTPEVPAAAEPVTEEPEDDVAVAAPPVKKKKRKEKTRRKAAEESPVDDTPAEEASVEALAPTEEISPTEDVPVTEEDTTAAAETPAEDDVTATADTADSAADTRGRNGFMVFLGGLVPHVGDGAFDIIRKCIMLIGIVVFIGAATYLVDDLVIIPVQNEILAESLQGMYTPGEDQDLTAEEENYTYPEGMDPSFKKLYYQNNDVRGWISFHSTDSTTISCEYPIVQAENNDFYLYHDYYGTYNKNGTLFFDYRNDMSREGTNKNTLIYGHNMLSGQMFAGINRLNLGLSYARSAPTFTMNTLYEKNEYKVFAVMALNVHASEGTPFNYLRTEFADNVDFAGFLSEILARSLYVYGDVDLSPDDEIVMLSTCGEKYMMHYDDSRTVVVARKVREGEDPSVDVSTITVNEDVIMPLAWYANQHYTLHPYYTDPNYVIQPIDGILDYIGTSTADPTATGSTTGFTLYSQDGTFGLISSRTTTQQTAAPVVQPASIAVTGGRTTYTVGESFDAAGTTLRVTFNDGSYRDISGDQCIISGFSSATPGTRLVTLKYGFVLTTMSVTIQSAATAAPAPTTTPTTAPPPVATTVTTTTTVPTEPTTTVTEAPAEETVAE